MRIANRLSPLDAQRILPALYEPRADSCIAVEGPSGQPITNRLAHIHFEKLAALPEDLRRKLLSSGHVYVRLDNVRHASLSLVDGNVAGGMFTFASELLGEAVGVGRYTKPEPDVEAMGLSSMGELFSFHRVMPEIYADRNANLELQGLDSDLRLYLDVGAVEAASSKQVRAKRDGR